MASGIPELVPAAGVFVKASCRSEWYENLQPRGSCFSLLSLLSKQRELIHELGPKGITVLHKGVQHGCVRLVKFILVNMFDDGGYCTCRVCGWGALRLTREQLLRKVCEDDITAVQMAVVSGSPKMVLLLRWAIKMNELEVKDKSSSKGDEVTSSEAARARIRRSLHRSTRNTLLFAGEEWDMEGEDMRRLFEVGNIEYCDSSTPTELRPADAEGEVVEETSSESVNDTDSNNVVVPDVKDDTINCVYEDGSEESVMIPMVYDVIESVLEDLDCFEVDVQEKVKMWKDKCMKDVDFEFVPVAHVFLHFLLGSANVATFDDYGPNGPALAIFGRIIRACYEHDLKEQRNPQGSTPQGSGSMVATLFKILDPRGRTFLHANVGSDIMSSLRFFEMLDRLLKIEEMPTSLMKECMNSKDGAGGTIVHLMCILEHGSYLMDLLCMSHNMNWEITMDWNAELSPLCCEELDTLKKWCFPLYRKGYSLRAIHLAILFDSVTLFNHIYFHFQGEGKSDVELDLFEAFHILETGVDDSIARGFLFQPIQLAAFLGRPTIIEEILKQPKLKPIIDGGIGGQHDYRTPAIHCAALSGQVEAIQSILKFPIYNPFIQHGYEGTALHYLLKRKNFKIQVRMFETLALLHVLPNSKSSARLKDEFFKLFFHTEQEAKMFSANEISCINLLLQAGIDIWTPNCKTGEPPSLGPTFNNAAREWWYNKVVNEVVIQNSSINNASNATSVIATLVTTASVIGPLQPPLGLGDDGYLHTSASAVRMYFVSNGLSFYFSIASILMAILFAIPMPKESLYDQLFRSQRCLKVAVWLLLVAIMCLLSSFTFASFAVVSLDQQNLLLVGGYVGIGGAVCSMVLVAYVMRMLRMVFHKNERFRRWFKKYMKF